MDNGKETSPIFDITYTRFIITNILAKKIAFIWLLAVINNNPNNFCL